MSMTLLAIESSGPGCSAAVWRDGGVAAARRVALVRGHAAALMPVVRDTVAAAGVAWDALAAIVVTVGPGSFTGIRVGLAAARGLGLALDIPVHGVTSFEAAAWAATDGAAASGPVAVLIDSGRAGGFLQLFDATLGPSGAPCALALDALPAALPPPPCMVAVVGAVVSEVVDAVVGALPTDRLGERRVVAVAPDAAALAALAAARLAAGGTFLPAAPVYLRPPDATVPRAGGRLRP
jgi:tRNA threonylcarbamoyladenosine biosynthesis protein TsaB